MRLSGVVSETATWFDDGKHANAGEASKVNELYYHIYLMPTRPRDRSLKVKADSSQFNSCSQGDEVAFDVLIEMSNYEGKSSLVVRAFGDLEVLVPAGS
jgi:hypothetical protein